MDQQYKAGVLVSGGMDSTVLAYHLAQNDAQIKLIYINYGQHFMDTELESLDRVMPNHLIQTLKIIDVSSVYSDSKSVLIKPHNLWEVNVTDDMLYVPYRTLVMLSCAMGYAQSIGCTELYAGFIDSNYVKDVDCSSEFFEKLDYLNDMYKAVKLVFPFRHLTKRAVLNYGIEISAPIALSYSCQVNSKFPCGACANCVDRNRAIDSWEQDYIGSEK